jgi:hypothetical protein
MYGSIDIIREMQGSMGRDAFKLLPGSRKFKIAYLKHLHALVNNPTLANSGTNQRIENFLEKLRSFSNRSE